MAFPTTSVLDPFTGIGNNVKLSTFNATNWSAMFGDTNELVGTGSNTIKNNAAGTDQHSYWKATTFGPDVEVYATCTTIPESTRYVAVYARESSTATTSATGYELEWQNGTGWKLFKHSSSSVFTQLGATIASPAMVSGDSIGLEIIGITLTAYQKTSGAWASVGSRTDSTYSTSGNIAFESNGSSFVGDDFGGGAVVVSTTARPRVQILMAPYSPG